MRFLAAFRTGKLGTALLDDLSLPYEPFVFRDWSTVSSEQKEALARRMPWNPSLRPDSGMTGVGGDLAQSERSQREPAPSKAPEFDPHVIF